jgi:hypothetical protein
MKIAALVYCVSSEMMIQQFQIVLETEYGALIIATVRQQSLRLLEATRRATTKFNFVKEVRRKQFDVIRSPNFPFTANSCIIAIASFRLSIRADCDYDSDCALGLVCYRRGSGVGGDVPGCDGDATKVGTGAEDYCIVRPTSNTLNIAYDYEDDIGTYPIGACSADCDTGTYFMLFCPYL